MAEIIDQANELVEQNIRVALANRPVNHSAVSATHCEACGIEIPDARRAAVPGCTMCVDCKGITELKRKQAGGL
ncbi:TraR/DksA family transcriptional regulator [Mangrovibacter sp. SLW1]